MHEAQSTVASNSQRPMAKVAAANRWSDYQKYIFRPDPNKKKTKKHEEQNC